MVVYAELLNFLLDGRHVKVALDHIIRHISWSINNDFHHFVLESLEDYKIGVLSRSAELDTIGPNWFPHGFEEKYFLFQSKL